MFMSKSKSKQKRVKKTHKRETGSLLQATREASTSTRCGEFKV